MGAAILQALACTLVLGVFALGAGPAAAQRQGAQQGASQGTPQGTPGQFDFYVLSLSWSPTYCEDQRRGRGRDEPQCGRARPYAFVVHGLWPQYERGAPRACQVPPPYVPNRDVNAMLDLMPSRGLVIHQWKAHGTCSGLDASDYFALVRKARERVAIPHEFERLGDYRLIAPGDLEAAFRAANPGLSPEMISVNCDHRRLREVRICMSRDLAFRPCPEVDRRTCRLDRMVMPPVRGFN